MHRFIASSNSRSSRVIPDRDIELISIPAFKTRLGQFNLFAAQIDRAGDGGVSRRVDVPRRPSRAGARQRDDDAARERRGADERSLDAHAAVIATR